MSKEIREVLQKYRGELVSVQLAYAPGEVKPLVMIAIGVLFANFIGPSCSDMDAYQIDMLDAVRARFCVHHVREFDVIDNHLHLKVGV